MALTKTDFDNLDVRIENIVSQSVEQIQVETDLPPTIDQLQDNNKTLILSILVDTFISKISFPMQPGPEIGSISDA